MKIKNNKQKNTSFENMVIYVRDNDMYREKRSKKSFQPLDLAFWGYRYSHAMNLVFIVTKGNFVFAPLTLRRESVWS